MSRSAEEEEWTMGTRADFYIGRGENAEWLGSIAWDGYPDGIAMGLLSSTSEAEFKDAFESFVAGRDDFTSPDRGWPWPWDDSRTTDYAYAFDGGKVWISNFGREWFGADENEPEDDLPKTAKFPDMSGRKAMTLGPRSGVIVVGF